MFNRVAARHDELRDALAGGQVEAHAFAKMSKEYSELTPIAEAIAELRKARAERQDLTAMLADPEMKDLAEAELEALDRRLPELERGIQILLLPKDEADEKSAILEIRAGTGGDEAALFAAAPVSLLSSFWPLRVLSRALIGLTNVILPLAKPGMAIGTIFVVTLVMADFSTVQVMSGGQSASVALMMKNQMSLLQYPAAAANAGAVLLTTYPELAKKIDKAVFPGEQGGPHEPEDAEQAQPEPEQREAGRQTDGQQQHAGSLRFAFAHEVRAFFEARHAQNRDGRLHRLIRRRRRRHRRRGPRCRAGWR